MKILYVYNKMPGVYQHYLLKLLNTIKERLNVKSLVYEKSELADYNIKTYGFYDNIYRFLYKYKLLKFKSRDLKVMSQFDIVHLQHSFLWKKLIPFENLKERPKLIITLRGADTYLKPWSYPTLSNFYNDDKGLIDAFVVMSEHQRQYLKRWGVSDSKIHVIPISFENKLDIQPKYPNKNILKLMSAFRMTWEKNIEGHLQFAKSLKSKNIDFVYDIYGDGNNIDQLHYLVDKYGLSNCVFVKGKLENQKLKEVFSDYDFYLQLSISESLGMSVIEAQSYGLPCIVSNSGGLPEVVLRNESALVEDLSNISGAVDSCVELWKNPKRYHAFSCRAIVNANEKFNRENELKSLEQLYQQIYSV